MTVAVEPIWLIAVALLALVVLVVAVRSTHQHPLDPVRLFTPDQRRTGADRAGTRCEYKHPLWRRCAAVPEHADHIHPWSRGGATRMSNLQALCARHNLRKSDWVPTRLYIWRLQRRRRRYFPPYESVKVVWRLTAPEPATRRTAIPRPRRRPREEVNR